MLRSPPVFGSRQPIRQPAVPGRDSRARSKFIFFLSEYLTFDFHDLFTVLQRNVTRLENTVRWQWRPGDLAIWDNRATQHYAVAGYGDLPRRLHRVTVAGAIPVGIRGDTSVPRKGDASGYSDVAPV